MATQWRSGLRLSGVYVALLVVSLAPTIQGYDPLDPTGNITIVWDVPSFTGDGYMVNVNIFNNQFYRKIFGWQLSWTWMNGEAIWGMKGADVTGQGDCSRFVTGTTPPYCCLKNPVVVDKAAPKEGSPELQNCCKSGYLGCTAQDPWASSASFQMTVGNASSTIWDFKPPGNFSLPGVDGYSCTDPFIVPSTITTSPGSARKSQTLVTYQVVCTYSKEPVKVPPKCCVSLSSFYNSTIIPCPACSCACGSYGHKSILCLDSGDPRSYGTSFLTTTGKDGMELQDNPGAMECSPDGCPISIHYHLKANYKKYWRAKVTIINRKLHQNYSNWNMVMEHPNVNNMTEVFSFNATSVQPYGVNNTAVFWGLTNYNIILHEAGSDGNVQSEFLFAKTDDFTFEDGWGFPRKIMFNGEECAMPEEVPGLPPSASLAHRQAAASALVSAAMLALAAMLLL